MIRSEFIRIAKQEGGKLSYKDNDIAVGGGVRSPKLIYVLKINLQLINRLCSSYSN